MTEMTKKEIEKFLIRGTYTAKLATVKKEALMWFLFGLCWMTEKAKLEKE
jgi:hypothetical protein